jgi:hypothetical protein
MSQIPFFAVLATVFVSGVTLAQDADCFDGSCGGSKGIPQCAEGFNEAFLVTYANNDADVAESCTTVVSCTNLDEREVTVDCRFFHGFNSIPAGGGPQDALCSTGGLTLGPGDTGECATEVDDVRDGSELSGGIFTTTGGSAGCPPFEGKGLLCTTGSTNKVVCHAHLACRDENGRVLEKINLIKQTFQQNGD